MDLLKLEIAAEEFIISRVRVTPCILAKELECVTAELRLELSHIVSKLVLRNNWRTECINNRLFITSESAANKETKITHVKHSNEDSKVVLPKCLPVHGDWIVTCREEGCDTRLYFSGVEFTKDEARSSFAKSEHVKFKTTNVCRYRKIKPLKEMHNFNTRERNII